jgi:hypothetical protein
VVGSVSVAFTAPAAGTETLSVSTTAKLRAARSSTYTTRLATGTARFSAAGRGTVKVRFSARARRYARRARALRINLSSTFAPVSGKPVTVSTLLRLTSTPR